jgi:beta-mannosidase
MVRRKKIHQNWKFSLLDSSISLDTVLKKKISTDDWFDAVVPGTIHTDLINNHFIDDPFYADNEIMLQKINECNWVYQTEFNFVKSSARKINLVFEGLDTISEIFLNDVKLGDTDNMFLCYRYDVTNVLKQGNNKLKVIFHSAVKYASQLEKGDIEHSISSFSDRVYIRKAQYSFGWDWGPTFPTCGIWRNVFIEEFDEAIIGDVYFQTTEVAGTQAEVEVVTTISGGQNADLSLHILLSNSKHTFEERIKIGNNKKPKTVFKIEECNLWWPNGSYLSFHLMDLPSGKTIQQDRIEITLNKNNSKKIFDVPTDFIPDDEDKILIATVFVEKQNPVSRNFLSKGDGNIKFFLTQM